MKKLSFLIFLIFFCLSGCVATDFHYTPPGNYIPGKNIKVTNMPFDQTWKKMVAGLGSNFFVINNMDKESGFINISYSGDPEKYIDGGELYVMVENMAGKREYRFPASRRYAHYEDMINGALTDCQRSLELEGRINVVIASESKTKTRISVNTRYILTQKTTGVDVMGRSLPPDIQTISLNTGGQANNRGGTIYKANGKLEEQILNILN